ncbi:MULTISPECIES: flagellar hook-associated protein FlgL [Marinobacter]|jgi:flagellar hook-associated protein 3 FlgL|uniref:flagellar hook-associated protein FlgL n=1 Tax=Marinobacter TaxID=2742 RepID=UPI00200577AC|nr:MULTISPECIES: flagellar hook-associated protein FlgL [Marinobacter]MCK7551841.1 flagellar hook-associated protein FlgL [Marinobacter goseongensis]MDV3503850.1 flagellar hook-associated protein FlgL [Marinobacter sp. M-5]
MIRISSQQVFSGGINRIQDLNTSLNKTSEQVSTGKRVNRPSDDPVAAARILKLDQELGRVETYQRNAQLADNRLKQEESTLASAVDVIQRIRELTVQAGNGALSPNDRQSLASEMKERLGQLANIANTKDASGEFIFSGFQGNQQAFTQNVSGDWVYQGDEGQRVLEIDDGVTVPISDHGKGIFVDVVAAEPTFFAEAAKSNTSGAQISSGMVADRDAFDLVYPDDIAVSVVDDGAGGLEVQAFNRRTNDPLPVVPAAYTGGGSFEVAGAQVEVFGAVEGDEFTLKTAQKQSVFTSIEKLIYGLENIDKTAPGGQGAYDDLIASSLTNLDNGQESIVLKQTELGGRMNAVESTQSFLEDSSVYSNEIRSQLQDVDYAEAISTLSFQSFVLQAAQQSFAQVSQLSLFDRL